MNTPKPSSERYPGVQAVDAAQVAHLRKAGTPLFELGMVYGTPAVLQHLEAHGLYPNALLGAHCHGDYGLVDEDDWQANDRAVVDGSRILSSYAVEGVRIWVITDAVNEQGMRPSTTLLKPSEY
jgi:hypothetical protein